MPYYYDHNNQIWVHMKRMGNDTNPYNDNENIVNWNWILRQSWKDSNTLCFVIKTGYIEKINVHKGNNTSWYNKNENVTILKLNIESTLKWFIL